MNFLIDLNSSTLFLGTYAICTCRLRHVLTGRIIYFLSNATPYNVSVIQRSHTTQCNSVIVSHVTPTSRKGGLANLAQAC